MAVLGVRPAAVVGHSQGEIAAACVAGALSLEDAARVVCLRSRAITALAGAGGMAMVFLPEDRTADLLRPYGGRITVAAVNGPRSVVLSGDRDALEELRRVCERREIRLRMIPVDYASHSVHVEKILDELATLLEPVAPRTPEVPFFSTVTGDWIDGPVLDAAYWCANLRQPVRFADAVRALSAQGFGLFVECSPHPVLLAAIEETLEDRDDLCAVGSLRRDEGGLERFLLSLGAAWVRGAPVDWGRAFTDGAARSVPLPTYPFTRRRHWLEPPAAAARRDESAAIDGWRYRLEWTPVPAPGAASRLTGDWVVVTPREAVQPELVETVVKGLTARGATVHRLTAGQLATAAGELPPFVDGVLSLAALDERPEATQPAVTTGLADTVASVRALAGEAADAPLWLATRGAVTTADDDPVTSPAQAQIWGLGVVLGLDEPERWSGQLDLPAVLDDAGLDRLVDVLAGGTGENEVALRAGTVLGRRLVPAPAGPAEPWRPRGTVLITGGTGALGAHVARWAAANGAAHLVLTSRRGADAPGAKELYEELTGLGARVTIAACDVADPGALAAVLAAIPAGDPLTAVVHAAGLTQPEIPVAHLSTDELARVIRVKTEGARNLDALTAGTELDAFVLFSSGAGTWGDRGKGAYAAANAHLDALAHQRHARGEVATAVAWGAWAGGGMVDGEVADLLTRRGVRMMRPESAVRALAVAVGSRDTSIAVASFDLSRFLPLYTMKRPRPLVEALVAAQQVPHQRDQGSGPEPDPQDRTPALARRLAGLSADEQEAVLVDVVRREAAGVLKAQPDEIRPKRAFKEIGFDSLTALEFRNRLNAATGLRLPATLVFDHPTPLLLARQLRDQLSGGTDPVRDGLDLVEAGLAALPEDDRSRADIVERLRTLLRRAEAADGSGTGAQSHDDLAAATNDEIFDLIDRELGI